MNNSATRSRWAAIGAAVAVVLGAGSIGLVSATNPSDATAYVPTEPCRLADTRPTELKGPKATPIGAGATHTIGISDANTDCTAATFAGATGLQLNVTALNATSQTFLTFWANGDPQPLTASLNPSPGQPPTPNAVTVGLNGAGEFNVFNEAGTVDVVVDVVGFYTDHNHDDRYYQKSETYTQAEVDNALADKANSADVYTKAEVDALVPDPDDPCGPGKPKAVFMIHGLTLTTTFEPIDGYHCSGGSIEARSPSTGEFEFDIEGLAFDSTTEGMVVQLTGQGGSGGTIIGYGAGGPADRLRVQTYDNEGGPVDKVFSVTIWEDSPPAS